MCCLFLIVFLFLWRNSGKRKNKDLLLAPARISGLADQFFMNGGPVDLTVSGNSPAFGSRPAVDGHLEGNAENGGRKKDHPVAPAYFQHTNEELGQ